MQIHELTQKPKLDEGVWDTIKQGAKTYGRNVAQQFGASATGAQAAGTLGASAGNLWLQKVNQLQRLNQNQPLDDASYQAELEEFIDNALFKGQLSLLPPAGKQAIQHGIHKIMTQRANPRAVATGFNEIVQSAAQTQADPRAALQKWVGQVLKVNLNQGGVTRPAAYSWDGTNWIDAQTGQVAPLKLKQVLTRTALGQV